MPAYDRALIVDSGFLVALFAPREPTHEAALAFVAANYAALVSIQSVIAESCSFLGNKGRRALGQWIARGAIELVDIPSQAYSEIGAIVQRYANLDPDFADCALVWLANEPGCERILALEKRDFATFPLKGSARFELIEWVE